MMSANKENCPGLESDATQSKNRFGFKPPAVPEEKPVPVVVEETPVVVEEKPRRSTLTSSRLTSRKPLTARTTRSSVLAAKKRAVTVTQTSVDSTPLKSTKRRVLSSRSTNIPGSVTKATPVSTRRAAAAPVAIAVPVIELPSELSESNIQGTCEEIFQKEFLLNCKDVLNMKVHAKRHDYKGQLSEQKEIIFSFRTCMKDMLIKRKAFVQYSIQVEQLLLNKQQSLEEELFNLRESETILADKVNDLESERQAKEAMLLQAQETESKIQSKQVELENERTQRKIENESHMKEIEAAELLLMNETNKLNAKINEYNELTNQLTTIREEHSIAIKQYEDNVNTLKQNMALSQHDAQADLKQHESEKESLQESIIKLEEENSKLREEITTSSYAINELKSEEKRRQDHDQFVEKEIKRNEDQITELKEEIKRKDEQSSQMISSFSQQQSFIQELTKQLNDTKTSSQQKIDDLTSTNTDLNNQNLELTHSLQITTESLTNSTSENEKLTQEGKILKENLNNVNAELAAFVSKSETLYSELNAKYSALCEEHTKLEESSNEKVEELSSQINELVEQMDERNTELTKVTTEKDSLFTERNNLLNTKTQLNEEICDLKIELNSMKENLNVGQAKQLEAMSAMSVQTQKLQLQLSDKQLKEQEIEQLRQQVSFLLGKTSQQEASRRKLHNKMQEMKGNIRVLVRIRPILPSDGDMVETSIDVKKDKKTLVLHVEDRNDYKFEFDQIFAPTNLHHKSNAMEGDTDNQESVYEEVSDLVQSALDGYNVCLFSYGQTGSGKTWTMQGGQSSEQKGIIPRALSQIMQKSQDLVQQGWDYKLEASYLEIYNDNLIDLLSPPSAQAEKTLFIRQDPTMNNRLYVPGLTKRTVACQQDIQDLVEMAHKKRSVAFTDMNAVSSRSHAVFTLYLTGKNTGVDNSNILHGTLNLVDLAGSERLSRSKVEGKRLEETKNINKSLSTLADVFTSLSNKASHIPFRNSKLTYLLQNCLSNSGKTLMFINLSPTSLSSQESLCSLRFAQVVQKVRLGKVKKITQKSSSNDDSNVITKEDMSVAQTPISRKRPSTASVTSARHSRKSSAPASIKRAKRT